MPNSIDHPTKPIASETTASLHRTEIRYSATSTEENCRFSASPPQYGLPLGLLELIEWISLHHPQEKRRILRSRIETTDAPTPAFKEMIKVAAKRSSTDIAPRSGGKPVDPTAAFRAAPLALIHSPTLFEYEKNHLSDRDQRPLYEQNRAVIASVWTEGRDAPNSVRANRSHTVAAWHAEILLCLDIVGNAEQYRGQNLLWAVGLKPCRMCAAWISTLMRELGCSYQVVYARNDPGPLAQGTELDRLDGPQESLKSWGPRNPERARRVFGDVRSPSRIDE